LQQTPLRRVGLPEEVAAAILFLASPSAGFITGHNLVVDGGTAIHVPGFERLLALTGTSS